MTSNNTKTPVKKKKNSNSSNSDSNKLNTNPVNRENNSNSSGASGSNNSNSSPLIISHPHPLQHHSFSSHPNQSSLYQQQYAMSSDSANPSAIHNSNFSGDGFWQTLRSHAHITFRDSQEAEARYNSKANECERRLLENQNLEKQKNELATKTRLWEKKYRDLKVQLAEKAASSTQVEKSLKEKNDRISSLEFENKTLIQQVNDLTNTNQNMSQKFLQIQSLMLGDQFKYTAINTSNNNNSNINNSNKKRKINRISQSGSDHQT